MTNLTDTEVLEDDPADVRHAFERLVNMTPDELEAWLAAKKSQAVGHMRKTIGFIKRHLAQRPEGDLEDSRSRYSPMNWRHDPLQDE